MFTYASICYIPLSFKDLTSINIASITPDMYMSIFFVVFMATFIAYICMMTGQKLLRPTLVSMYNYVQPIVASITAVVIGLDSFGWNKFIAIIFVFVGVYIVTQSKSRAQLEAEKSKKINSINKNT